MQFSIPHQPDSQGLPTPEPHRCLNLYRGMDTSPRSHTTDLDAPSSYVYDNPGSSTHANNNLAAQIAGSLIPYNTQGHIITSLRNRYHFPTASILPHEDILSSTYFSFNPATETFYVKKHWAYLGEIIAMEISNRAVNLITVDMAWNELPVRMCSDCDLLQIPSGRGATCDITKQEDTVVDMKHPYLDAGDDIDNSALNPVTLATEVVVDGLTLKVGHTFIMGYPELHQYDDGDCGLWIDQTGWKGFNILPYSLTDILLANDEIVVHRMGNLPLICENCQKALFTSAHDVEGKFVCGTCQMAYYCKKECLPSDWETNCDKEFLPFDCKMLSSGEPKLSTKAGGLQTQGYERPHTQRCKLYKEVQRLIDRDWDYFENWQTMR